MANAAPAAVRVDVVTKASVRNEEKTAKAAAWIEAINDSRR
jgi:hypothetical protein